MPLFEYHCQACSARFEALVAGDGPEPTCPSCAAADSRRLLSVFSAPKAPVGASVGTAAAPTGGGCCGGACGC